jgi:gliding motility-associated-like protein
MKNIVIAISLILFSFGLKAQVNGCFGYLPPTTPPVYISDDGSTVVNLPFTFCFYGTNYTSLWVNGNGTVSFDQAHGAFSAQGFPFTGGFGAQEIIAPFWADFHQDGALSGAAHYQVLPNALIVHWNGVGYYSSHDDKLNTMMLVLTDGTSNLLQPGANVGFFYEDMQWTTGDASGGTGGFGGTPATVGVNRGNGVDFIQLGRFDAPGTGYDGPFNTPDSVSWLDDKSFMFNVCSSSNIPPIVAGIDICDTLNLCIGETLPINASFLAPEAGQLTWVEVDTTLCDGFQITNIVSGTNSTAQVDGVFTADTSNLGLQTITFMAYDNGTPSDTIAFDYIIFVDSMPYLPIITGDTSYCAGTDVTLSASGVFDSFLWSTASVVDTTLATQGSHTVTVTLNGCSYTTPPYIVTEIPAATGSLDSTICFGTSFVYNGTTYNSANNTGVELLSTALGCDSVVTVTVIESPLISNSLYYDICFRDSIIINGVNYNGANNFGTQTLTAANGCDSVITVTINEAPLITGSLDTTICFADSFILNGTTYDGSNLTGTEVLTANNGCDSVVSVIVHEEPYLFVNIAIPDTISCENSSVTLSGAISSGNITNYSWSTLDGNIISPNLNDTIAEVSTIGNYTLSIINNFGCTADSTITVFENFTTPITTDIVVPLCDDVPGLPLEVTIDLTSYDNQITNNDGVSEVEWFYDGALTNPILNPTSFTTSTVTYFILATNPVSKCTDSATVNFVINFTPLVSFTSDTVCEGNMTSFLNSTISIENITNTVWEFGDGTFSYLNSPQYIFTEPGIHSVSLTVTNDKQCTESFTADVEVFANPIADFSMDPNPATMLNPTVNFTNNSTLFTAVDSFFWDFGGISSSILKDPTYSFSEDTIGKHVILLEVVDQNECKSSKSQSLSILGTSAYYMPTAFSPNGDGLNDVFIPNGFGILDEGYSFMVFDRWGTLVFETKNKNLGWDGTFNGADLQTDTYVWKLTFLDFERISRSEMGHVNIIK